MSKVRVLVGTHKGAFILTSDGKREKWEVSGPHFAGWEIYHMKGSPVRSESHLRFANQRLVRADHSALRRRRQNLASAGNARRGRRFRNWSSRRARATSSPTTPPKVASRSPRISGTTARSIRGSSSACGIWSHRSPIPIRFTPAWKMPLCFARPTAARTGRNSPDCAATAPGRKWQPGAGGMCLHTIILDPSNPQRMFIAISAAGAFRTDDGGKTWKPINQGLRSQYIPDPNAEIGHCVHHVAMNPKRPGVLFMQKHWDVMRSDNAGDKWHEVSGNLPTDFGFVIDVHAHEPETIYVVPIKSDSEHYRARRQAARLPQPQRRQRVGGADQRSAAKRLLRQRSARCHGRRLARQVRHLFRHHRRAGVRVGRCRRQLGSDSSRSAGGAVGRGADAGVRRA